MPATTIDRGVAGHGHDCRAEPGGAPHSSPATPAGRGLTVCLRMRTAPAHALVEARLGLPAAIRTVDDYAALLARFLGIYRPLERLLTAFPDWSGSGIALPRRGHAECLASDLATLGVDPGAQRLAPHRLLPDLSTFPHAVGALYVLEGATLGGQLILRDLQPRLGFAIAGATDFFGGRGELTGSLWRDFRARVDAFGRARPWHEAAVVTGAERTFQAILAWFAPFQAEARR